MHQLAQPFAAYCSAQFDLTESVRCHYQSLPVCLIDCVYSLRARYYEVTVPIVQRYADAFLNGDPDASGDTLSRFLLHMEQLGGPRAFADRIAKNHQKLGGRAGIPKAEVCLQLAQYLSLLQIETLEDFRAFPSQELLEIVVRAVKGLGAAGTSYLFMLAGDENRCKPDVHIHHCIRDACGLDVSDESCQSLFADAVALLRPQYPQLTVRGLDSVIWRRYQSA